MIPPITTSKHVNDLVRDIEEGRLILRPPFQRRTVWTPAVKDHFLETVSLGLPFPEIFIVTGHTDPATRKRVDHLVDGQQRLSTLREYLDGSDDITYEKVKPYAELGPDEQKRFLSYPVAVRDLRDVDAKTVADIFNRINSTDYALKATERFNALFTGEFRSFCEELAGHQFFKTHRIFSATDWKRMGDLTFCLTLVTTLLAGYFRREELLVDYLGRFNDSFPENEDVRSQLETAFRFVDDCKFPPKCRVWKKTDLFTLLVEVCYVVRMGKVKLDPTNAGMRLNEFYAAVDQLYQTNHDEEVGGARNVPAEVLRYMKAATKATNDKYARVDRADVIAPLLIGEPEQPKARRSKKKP